MGILSMTMSIPDGSKGQSLTTQIYNVQRAKGSPRIDKNVNCGDAASRPDVGSARFFAILAHHRDAMKTFYMTCLAVCMALPSFAQHDYEGCHFFRNMQHMPRAKKLTPAQQKTLQNSILRSDTIDILHYEIDIDVTRYNQMQISANTTLTFTPLQPDVESITLDLYQLTVDSVKQGNEALNYTYDDELLHIQFNQSPVVGETYDLTVWYRGQPHADPFWGGFYFANNYIYNLGIGLTTIPPNFGKVWYPCFDTFVERATYTYHVTSAGGRLAVCQGDLFDEIELGGDTLRRSFHLATPIPSYLSAIAVANYDVHSYVHEGVYGDVEVQLAAKPANLNGMINTFQELGQAIDACEYWWGPMVWNRVGYIYTTAGALEIPTNIAYPEFMVNENLNSNGRLIAHELGHYWWGDVVTMIRHNDMWIKEGPAEYSAHLFFEWRDGREGFIEVVKDNHLFVLENAHIQDNGFHPMSPMPDEHIYGRHTYRKGASVLHNLRAYLGDELFRQGMQAIQEHLAFSNMDPTIFRDSLSVYTGYDLTSFFDDQILAPGFSTFVIDSLETAPAGNGEYTTQLFIQQKLRECPHYYTNVPLEVTAMDANWVKHNFMVMVGDQYSQASITTNFEPVLVTLNSNGLLNQGRTDYEMTVSSTGVLFPRPYVAMRTATDAINPGDSAFVRFEHQWAGPDNHDVAFYIDQMSSTHFWTVDGIWPDGLEMRGRISYRGAQPTDLDYDLVGGNEQSIMLVWRPDASHPWVIHPDYTLQAGNLFDGTGQMAIHRLLKGQYSFANGDVSAAVASLSTDDEHIRAWPVPANEQLNLSWRDGEKRVQQVVMHDVKGRQMLVYPVSERSNATLSTGGLPAGWYRITLLGPDQQRLGAKSILIAH